MASPLTMVAGLALILLTLWDAFETVILPRRVSRLLRLSRVINAVGPSSPPDTAGLTARTTAIPSQPLKACTTYEPSLTRVLESVWPRRRAFAGAMPCRAARA